MLGPLLASVHTIFGDSATYFIPTAAVLSIVFAVWLWGRVSTVRVAPATHTRSENGREYLLEEEQRGEDEVHGSIYPILDRSAPICNRLWRIRSSQAPVEETKFFVSGSLQVVQKAADLQDAIAEGANSFLFTEYKYMAVFMVCLAPSSLRWI